MVEKNQDFLGTTPIDAIRNGQAGRVVTLLQSYNDYI